MSNIEISSSFNDTNITCPLQLRWSQSIIDSQRRALYVCIVAAIIHSIFWLHVGFSSSIRQKTMQWLYAYLVTDIILLCRFFVTFIVRTQSTECIPNSAWYLFVCYLEATADNYVNTLEVYILLALNICRYMQIAHRVNVYVTYVRLLICAHLITYLVPLIIYIIQLLAKWALLQTYIGASCDIGFINIYIQVGNVIFAFFLPISLNLFVIYCNISHIRLASLLSQTQHRVTAREKYNRSLVIQFTVFYAIWLLLWSPNVIVYQFTSGTSSVTIIASLLNYIEIALDPIIISGLDVRFQKSWYALWTQSTNILLSKAPNQRQVAPTTTNQFRSTGFARNPTTKNRSRSNGNVQQLTTILPT